MLNIHLQESDNIQYTGNKIEAITGANFKLELKSFAMKTLLNLAFGSKLILSEEVNNSIIHLQNTGMQKVPSKDDNLLNLCI
jgi:hypothetical protein